LDAGDSVIRVEIPRRVPSQNESVWAHWRVYSGEKKKWFALMSAALPKREPPERKVMIWITSYRNRELDHMNLVGGCKPIPDCLKQLGYIKDDSPKWFDYVVSQEKCARDEERTVVEIDL
jgi:hypothetical protein